MRKDYSSDKVDPGSAHAVDVCDCGNILFTWFSRVASSALRADNSAVREVRPEAEDGVMLLLCCSKAIALLIGVTPGAALC